MAADDTNKRLDTILEMVIQQGQMIQELSKRSSSVTHILTHHGKLLKKMDIGIMQALTWMDHKTIQKTIYTERENYYYEHGGMMQGVGVQIDNKLMQQLHIKHNSTAINKSMKLWIRVNHSKWVCLHFFY
jgi:hypothetical protein